MKVITAILALCLALCGSSSCANQNKKNEFEIFAKSELSNSKKMERRWIEHYPYVINCDFQFKFDPNQPNNNPLKSPYYPYYVNECSFDVWAKDSTGVERYIEPKCKFSEPCKDIADGNTKVTVKFHRINGYDTKNQNMCLGHYPRKLITTKFPFKLKNDNFVTSPYIRSGLFLYCISDKNEFTKWDGYLEYEKYKDVGQMSLNVGSGKYVFMAMIYSYILTNPKNPIDKKLYNLCALYTLVTR